ncbi:exonuclease SbcCD subunit D C-terminal domain-containing protein [Flammeovirga aprica]|uniref:Nuclease SbcCD subunit D n=1 Tax=Flammeovirga aprica JL-4 TaxID=694437 RepID=A0A7X9RXY3_9BACT|nr:exonuclease SbcCD subunit D C-terminal domain-containing protein [Flammeovirga aprica]NME70785.1 exonuclease subunit SbcD [Flammeovirga aprica JL-4]
MKILHTADLHIGNRLHEQSQAEEQQLTLDWMIDLVQKEKIDVVLISGDVFDTAQPSGQNLKMYYKFLTDLVRTDCKKVIITGGNHDGASVLNAPKELLSFLDVTVVGKISENVEEEVFDFEINGEKVVIAAVPFLRDQDIRKATSGQQFDHIGDRFKEALIEHYQKVGEVCEKKADDKSFVIGMGHLFAIGGETSTSESERSVYVGGLGDIGADDFPKVFDYTALGHLHRSQKVKYDHIRYSGSPYILSFSEIHHKKEVIILSTKAKDFKLERVSVPVFRTIKKIKGNLDECLTELTSIATLNHQLTPWIEVVVADVKAGENPIHEIYKHIEELDVEVLKIGIHKELENRKVERVQLSELEDLTPEETFLELCQLRNLDLDDDPNMKDAFYEIYNKVKERS